MVAVAVTLLLLSSCAQRPVKFEFKSIPEASDPKDSDVGVSWNRAFAFHDADVRLPAKDEHPKMAQVHAGQHTVLVMSEGSVEFRSANLLQYRTVVVTAPSELLPGQDVKLKWADYGSTKPMKPGEVVASVKNFFSGQAHPKPGQMAGGLKILSVTGEKIRLQLELVIHLKRSSPGDREEIGRLSRDLEVERQTIKSPLVVRKFPEGANQEVGVPRLGRMW